VTYQAKVTQPRNPRKMILRDFSDGPINTDPPYRSGWFDIGHLSIIQVAAEARSISGTGPGGTDLRLEASLDDYWSQPDPELWRAVELPFEYRDYWATGVNGFPVQKNQRNIAVFSIGGTPPVRVRAFYGRLPARYVRLTWGPSGSYAAGEGTVCRAVLLGK